jgi:glycosyltransferase involved in cell wall biosynthesis
MTQISVVIPVLNGEDSLVACLKAVQNQDTILHEIIVVDNNSTDKTKEIILEFQKLDPRILYVFEPMRTRGAARNAGIERASGNIIAMTDVDCVVPTHWIRVLTQPIIDENELMVGGGQHDISDTYWSRHMQQMGDLFLRTAISDDGYVFFCDTKNFAVDTVFMKHMRFDSRFKALENVEFDHRIRPIARVKFLQDHKVGHKNVDSMLAVWKLWYARAYWYAQIYHKFKGKVDKNGVLIFPILSPIRFYLSQLQISFQPIRDLGVSHIPFWLVCEVSSRIGSMRGFFTNQIGE